MLKMSSTRQDNRTDFDTSHVILTNSHGVKSRYREILLRVAAQERHDVYSKTSVSAHNK